jgi:hypothetical protein
VASAPEARAVKAPDPATAIPQRKIAERTNLDLTETIERLDGPARQPSNGLEVQETPMAAK